MLLAAFCVCWVHNVFFDGVYLSREYIVALQCSHIIELLIRNEKEAKC